MWCVWDADPLLGFLAASALLKFCLLSWRHRKRPGSAECVGEVSALRLYPLKSGKHIDTDQITCTQSGLNDGIIEDRNWMIVDGQGTSVNAKTEPAVITMIPSFHGNTFHLDAPGQPTLKVDSENVESNGDIVHAILHGVATQGLDCGHEATRWLQAFFQGSDRTYKLLYCPPGLDRRSVTNSSKRWKEWCKVAKEGDKVAYADTTHALLIPQESVADLNARLASPVAIDRFRPNIITRGSQAFSEDDWKELYIGDVKFSTVKLCGRCPVTTISPKTGQRDPGLQPLKTLRSYRLLIPDYKQAAIMGINLVTDWEGIIRVGDPVYVLRGDNVTMP